MGLKPLLSLYLLYPFTKVNGNENASIKVVRCFYCRQLKLTV